MISFSVRRVGIFIYSQTGFRNQKGHKINNRMILQEKEEGYSIVIVLIMKEFISSSCYKCRLCALKNLINFYDYVREFFRKFHNYSAHLCITQMASTKQANLIFAYNYCRS